MMDDGTHHETQGPPDRVWERGWDGHRRLQMERLANLPLSEKLAWLEEAHRLIQHMRSVKTSNT